MPPNQSIRQSNLYVQQQQQMAPPNTIQMVASTSSQIIGSGMTSVYPPDSVEAIIQNQHILKRKRPKVFARDLTMASFYSITFLLLKIFYFF